ncbi:hypothetical protein JTE90_029443 [Oedothorax gibbosus]|uniref:Uncharacterized protein n=1 Tax=Oedothorax gibbosus TaxID=931172 RepID=A0AAV6U118_9ARAC|nr:hypothetical protein JTE90_029443 [Oedothorax gibbosus]
MSARENLFSWKEQVRFVEGKGMVLNLKTFQLFQTDRRGDTPLHKLLSYCKLNETTLRQILDKGAPVNAQNHFGMTPLHCALSEKINCELPILRLLVDRGADVRMEDHQRRCSSYFAAGNKNISIEILEFLSERGADFHTRKKHIKSQSVLDYAIKRMQPSLDVIKWLFEKVADVSAVNEYGDTTLHLAALFHRKDVIELILKKQNIDVNLQNSNGDTPLHRVFLLSFNEFHEIQFDIVKILLEAGADANKKISHGEGALHLAAASGLCNPSVIKLLLDYGANVNESNTNGETPLELAVNNKKSSRAVVKILLDAGAIIIKEHPPFSNANNILHSAIKIYQDQLRNQHLPQRSEEVGKIVILLLKYSLLERPDTSYHLLQLDEEILRILKVFEEQCHQELNKPCPKFLKLAQLFRYCRLHKDLPRHEIITMLFNNCCPIYKDVLEGLMKRKDLEEVFKSYVIYVDKNPDERIVLNYDVTCNVMQYLTENDLLNLLLAV